MPTFRALCLAAAVALAVVAVPHASVGFEIPVVSLDPNKGTREGSPIDHLPDNIRLLDIRLPDGGAPQRADWSPDGKRLLVLDAPIGDLWEYDLATGATTRLTEGLLHDGVIRAHHLTNG